MALGQAEEGSIEETKMWGGRGVECLRKEILNELYISSPSVTVCRNIWKFVEVKAGTEECLIHCEQGAGALQISVMGLWDSCCVD